MQQLRLTSQEIRTIDQMDRRQFVGLLGAGGFGLFLNPTLEKLTALFNGIPVPAGAADLPAEWIQRLGQPLNDYSAWLSRISLKHIPLRKIIEPHLKDRGGVLAGLPPSKLWRNMRPTLLAADRIAERLGEKVETVISAYRCPAYNARCPGAASNSQHTRNGALDLQFNSSPARVAKVARELRAEGVFRGGVGLYRDFTHIDTRGYAADW